MTLATQILIGAGLWMNGVAFGVWWAKRMGFHQWRRELQSRDDKAGPVTAATLQKISAKEWKGLWSEMRRCDEHRERLLKPIRERAETR
jgi:hypothetical protein